MTAGLVYMSEKTLYNLFDNSCAACYTVGNIDLQKVVRHARVVHPGRPGAGAPVRHSC